MRLITQSQTAQPLCFLMVLSSDHITGATGLSPTVTLSKNGGSYSAASGAVTEIGNGYYKVAGNATDSATLGPLLLHATAATADPCDVEFEVIAPNVQSATNFGLTNLDAAITSRMATFTLPTNFSSLAITAGGAVTAGTVSDKTGYSLTQSFPANFSALVISGGGSIGSVSGLNPALIDAAITSRMATYVQPTGFLVADFTTGFPVTGTVTVGTNNDKTGYSVTGTTTTLDALQTALSSSHGAGAWATATGFAVPGDSMTLTSAYDASKTAAQASTALSTAVWTSPLATALGVTNAQVLLIPRASGGTFIHTNVSTAETASVAITQ